MLHVRTTTDESGRQTLIYFCKRCDHTEPVKTLTDEDKRVYEANYD
jgi:DNA-directed RNA polymerase subunit M/transcription elongation factor TFIIS